MNGELAFSLPLPNPSPPPHYYTSVLRQVPVSYTTVTWVSWDGWFRFSQPRKEARLQLWVSRSSHAVIKFFKGVYVHPFSLVDVIPKQSKHVSKTASCWPSGEKRPHSQFATIDFFIYWRPAGFVRPIIYDAGLWPAGRSQSTSDIALLRNFAGINNCLYSDFLIMGIRIIWSVTLFIYLFCFLWWVLMTCAQ